MIQLILERFVEWISKRSRRKLSFKQLKNTDEIRITSREKSFNTITQLQQISEVISFLKSGYWYLRFVTPSGGELRLAFYSQRNLLLIIFFSKPVLMIHGEEIWWRDIEESEYRKLWQLLGLDEQEQL